MNNYNCRLQDGTLKLVLPGQSRRQLYCPGCAYTYQSPGCLFNKSLPDRSHGPVGLPPNPSPRKKAAAKKRAVADVKKRWLELGRVPILMDFEPQHGTVSKHTLGRFPGGFKRALQTAAAELGLHVVYKCERCGREFTAPQALGQHRHFCTEAEG